MKMRLPISVLMIILFSTAASAQPSSNLPTALPAKLPTKKSAKSPAKSTLIVKMPAKKSLVASSGLPAKKASKAIVKIEVQASNSGLPKSLPAKKTVKIDFTQKPASADSSLAVVIREDKINDDDSTPRTNADAQTVRSHEVKEAPYLEVITENGYDDDGIIHDQHVSSGGTSSGTTSAVPLAQTQSRGLRQALPDSDSYLDAPVEARPQIAVQLPPKKSTVVAAPPVASPPLAPLAPALAPSPEATTALVESANEKLEALHAVNMEAPPSTLRTIEAPPTLEPAKVVPHPSTLVTESEVALEKDKNARDANPPSAQLKTTYFIPRGEIPKRRLFVRTGYLDARYSKVQADLKNGATLIGVSASQVFSQTEVRLGLDVAHGLDQAVTLRNTRMAIFRAEGLYHLYQNETFTGFIGGAIGVADIDVTSYRSTSSGDVVLRENAKGTALLGSPELGARARIGRELSLDLTLQYLLLAGKDEVSGLGGALAEIAVGFSF